MRVEGKVAFITGAARGQGRAHALRLAEEGADLILVDVCRSIETVDYPGSSEDDLEETKLLVQKTGQRAITAVADVRDYTSLETALKRGLAELGHLDVVIANAGVMAHPAKSWQFSDEQWQTTIDINLTGVWHTLKAAATVMLEQGTGGSIILISSTAGGAKGAANFANYVVSKHGVLGLAKTAAVELGPDGIRVNCILPTSVNTQLIRSQPLYDLFRPDLDNPSRDDCEATFESLHLLPLRHLEPKDVADAALWLASDESKWVTGLELRVDAGYMIK